MGFVFFLNFVTRFLSLILYIFRWEADTGSSSTMVEDLTHISYNVTNFEFLYEPFYVSTDLVPMHDERFLGYGFTRNTQVNLMMFHLP